MLFVFHMIDKPLMSDTRSKVRPAHKAYLAAVADRIAFAGPLLAENGETMVGSLLVIDFASKSDALKWLDDEPFIGASLYEHVHVHSFTNLWPQRVGFVPAT